jgi:hypothetical protein
MADHPLVRECLNAHGFETTDKGQFSNGRATVQFAGTSLVATPTKGFKAWRSDLSSASPEAVLALLKGLLATPPFLSQQEIDRRLERTHAAKIAIDRIVEVIRERPETPNSLELRRFLWSLFNGHHAMNLWTLRNSLDAQQAGWTTELFAAWMDGHVPEELLRRALTDSGGMNR